MRKLFVSHQQRVIYTLTDLQNIYKVSVECILLSIRCDIAGYNGIALTKELVQSF